MTRTADQWTHAVFASGSTMKLSVATCYVPVDADLRRNRQYVLQQMRTARAHGAEVAHFPEACLSGYAGTDFPSYRGFDWPRLAACTQDILDLAGRLGLWVLLGSTHRLTPPHKPHDSVYVINAKGQLVDRYDKRFCSTEDLAHYSPGNHAVVFSLKGVRCGVLICYEYAFPELYLWSARIPSVHSRVQVSDGRRIVLLLFGRTPPSFIEHQRFLRGAVFLLSRLRDRGDELGTTASFENRLCRLTIGVSFPVSRGANIRRVQDGVVEEWVSHSLTRTLMGGAALKRNTSRP